MSGVGEGTKGERRNGLLHPKSYLWVINEVFDGGLKDIPIRLETLYWNSCKAWKKYPHNDGLAKWEQRRFHKLFCHMLGINPTPLAEWERTSGKEPSV